LKELTGKFGPQVESSSFRADNVYVEHFKIWLKNVFFSNVESKSSLLIDSWTGHCSDTVKSVEPSDKEVESVEKFRKTFLGQCYITCGYTVVKPDTFENPVKFAFGDDCKSHCNIPGCENITIIRCSWCKKSLCLKHFFEVYHKCNTYIE
ncbi:hypothetical protein PV326_000104, partial [Microctonus aethiopoides]